MKLEDMLHFKDKTIKDLRTYEYSLLCSYKEELMYSGTVSYDSMKIELDLMERNYVIDFWKK